MTKAQTCILMLRASGLQRSKMRVEEKAREGSIEEKDLSSSGALADVG